MIKNKFIDFITENSLIENGDSILIAFSGGPDSVFLYTLLKKIEKIFKLKLFLFHLNHNLRGKESVNDEKFCYEFAKKNNIEIFIHSEDIRKFSKEKKISLEEAGRKVRYSFLKKIANNYNIKKIATAHHFDDQIETFFINLFRGRSLTSFQGIKLIQNNIIRPILIFTKQEILNYCKENNLNYVVDSSNFKNIFLRNKIRNLLMPEISKNFGNNFKQNIFNLMSQISQINTFLNDFINEFLEKNLIKENSNFKFLIKSLPDNNFIRLEIYKKIFSLFCEYDYRHKILYSLDYFILTDKVKGKFIFKNIVFYKEYEYVYVEKNSTYFNKNINLKIKEFDNLQLTEINFKNKNKAYFDAEKIAQPLTIRYFQEGDRFIPFGMNHSVKLKDFFINNKIPKRMRRKIPLLVDKFNKILWVYPYRIHDHVKVTEKTKKILRCEISFIE